MKPKQKQRFKIKNEKRFLYIFWSLVAAPFVLVSVLLTLIYCGAYGKLPSFEELENPKSSISTDVISEDGVQLGGFFIENRSFVDYDELSPNLVGALISTEDSRFYGHSGIDIIGLMRVGVKSLLLGQKQGGGSTISQQLAKNLYPRDTTSYSSSVTRNANLVISKFKEWITATMLEYNYTKEEIVVMYLNTVPYGSNAYGIKSAAHTFFGKKPSELSVEEAAMLVGVVNAPTRYSPVRNYDAALSRRNTVIRRMQSNDLLTRKQSDSLCIKPIKLDYNPVSHSQGVATYFRTMLRLYMTASEPKRTTYVTEHDFKQLEKLWINDPLYGWCNKNKKADGSPYNLYRDGLKIYTTINYKMQKYAEEALYENMKESVQPRFDSQSKARRTIFTDVDKAGQDKIIQRAMKGSERYRVMKKEGMSESKIMADFKKPTSMTVFSYRDKNGIDTVMTPYDSVYYSMSFLRSSFLAVEPASGYIKAYVGGVDYNHFIYDMATQGKRQAGSTFKPFIYTFAIDQLDISPCTPVPNLPVTVDGWSPKEAGTVEQIGEMHPLWWGLAMSRNNYSAWIMKQANQHAAVADFVNRLGIKSYIDPVASLCLGAATVSLLEMVSAYTDYVNSGVHIEPIFVTRIEDMHGNILSTFSPQSYDAISSQSAYTMLGLLQNVVNRGTASRLRNTYKFVGEMGGKTGTTNNNADAWFMGVTPQIVAGAWVGGDDINIHLSSRGEGSVVSLPVFGRFMQKVYADKSLGISERDKFVRPEGVRPLDCEEEQIQIEDINRSKNDEDTFFN